MTYEKPSKTKLKMTFRIRAQRKMWLETARYLYNIHSLYAVPTTLDICLTNLCNIKCPYCMRETFKPPEGVITLEKVKWLMGKMPYIGGICIMGLCEPFLNPDAPNIVRYLKDEAGRKLALTTNGMVPLTDDRLDCLLRVDDFVISIDTSDPETFHYLRGGANLDRVMDSLDTVLQFKRKLGLGRYDNPPLHINAVITTENFIQIPGLITMLEPYAKDIKYLMLDPVSRPDYSKFDPLALTNTLELEESIMKYRKIAKKSPLQIVGLDYMLKPSYRWNNCPLSWLSSFIEPNGDVYFCYNFKYVLGNVFEKSLISNWNSSKARAFRKKLCTTDPPLQQCRCCNFAREGWQLGGSYNVNPKDIV